MAPNSSWPGKNAPGGCTSASAAPSTLARESTCEIVLTQPEVSDYDVLFNNKPSFWSDAAGLDATEDDTPPTSLGSGTCLNASGSGNLKRKPSQNLIESARLIKKQRVTESDRPYVNLSPTPNIQRGIDARHLPYSVQWELARLVSKDKRAWEGEDARTITFPDLDYLRPSEGLAKRRSDNGYVEGIHSEGARKVVERFSNGENGDYLFSNRGKEEKRATDPWPELEKEDEFAENDPLYERVNPNGGKIHFSGTLKVSGNLKKPTISDFRVELHAAEIGPSCSFSRRWGSKSFFRLKVHKIFYFREETAFYFRTNDRWDGITQVISPAAPSTPGLSLRQFLDWYNPIEANQKQTMAKWAARFALGLSSSAHGVTLEEENIHVVDDIIVNKGTKEESNMTDGAGFITRCLLQELTLAHEWETRPSAIQIRVRGSKGLLVEHPTWNDDILGIQLRHSLVKIRYDKPLDVTQRSIDILRVSHSRSPIRISTDVIINLSANGVSNDVLNALMSNTVEAVVRPFLQWDSDIDSLHQLWLAFERAGSVIRSRRAREEVALARVKGYTERDTTEAQDDEDTQGLEDTSVEWWPDDVSGCPSSLEETIMGFLDSGFHPKTCTILRDKICGVLQKNITRTIENCVIEIPLSASAWIIPDPFGVLEPGQLFFRSSQHNLRARDGSQTDIITGDILITRDPCRLPTDVQKWRAVDVLQLHYLKDVIVLPVKGARRAADWLAGGDYDGDKAKIIWQPELVTEFSNASEHFADRPPGLDNDFQVQNETVKEFLERVHSLTPDKQLYEMQECLLGMMQNQGAVGQYSMFHEYSTCVNGYKHEKTKRLAHMFNIVLDGRKTGKTVKTETRYNDQKEFGQRRLKWKDELRNKRGGELASDTNVNPIGRPGFIMETLALHGKALKGKYLAEVEQWKTSVKHENDPDLLKPKLEIEEKIESCRSKGEAAAAACLEHDYKLIRDHVETMYGQHRDVLSAVVEGTKKHDEKSKQAGTKRHGKTGSTTSGGVAFTELPIQIRQNILRMLSREFHAKPLRDDFLVMTTVEANMIKASYAYYYDSKPGHGHPSRFPWNVAFRDLCYIKAGPESKPVHRTFYYYMKVKPTKNPKSRL